MKGSFKKNNTSLVVLTLFLLCSVFVSYGFGEDKKPDKEKLKKELAGAAEIDQAKKLNKLAKVYMQDKDKTAALNYGMKALALAEKYNQEKEALYAMINISVTNRKMKNFDLARKYIKKALVIAERRGNKKEILDVLIPRERIYEYDGFDKKLKDVVKISNRILSISKELGDDKTTVYFHRLLGSVYYRLGDKSKSYKSYQNAVKVYEKLDNKGGVAHMLTYLGSLNRLDNKYEKALSYYLEAKKIAEEHDLKSKLCRVYSDLGHYYYLLKDYEKAIHYFDTGLPISIEHKYPFWELVLYSHGGRVKVLQGSYREAIENYLLPGLETVKKKSYFHELDYYLIILLNLSKAYQQTGEPEAAYQYALQVLVHSKKNNAPEYVVDSQINLAQIHMERNNDKQALSLLKKGFKNPILNKDKDLYKKITKALSDLYLNMGKKKKSAKYLKLHKEGFKDEKIIKK